MPLLDLGCGTTPHPRAEVGLDRYTPFLSESLDITSQTWPLGDETFDEVYCSHVMEHVLHGEPTLHVLREVWRVLKPGGTFTVILPLVGWTPQDGAWVGGLVPSWQAYADPTHVTSYWMPESFRYWCEGDFHANADYGFPPFAPLGNFMDPTEATERLERERHRPAPSESWWTVRKGWEGIARMVKA